MGQPQSGYEQAAIYWREKYEYERARREYAEGQLKAYVPKQSLEIELKSALQIAPGVAAVLAILMQSPPGHIAKQAIFDIMPKRSDAQGLKLVDVLVCKARDALRKRGLGEPIQTIWGHGYSITVAGKEAIHAHIDAHYGRTKTPLRKINLYEDRINEQAIIGIQPSRQGRKRAVG